MTKRLRNLTVLPNDNGIRPAGPPDACFYCMRKVGEQHKPDCVVVIKEVELQATFEDGTNALYTTTAPHSWDAAAIEFRFNEGTWCANNLCGYDGPIAALAKVASDKLGPMRCLCGRVKIKYVRDVDAGPYIEAREEELPS